MRELILSEVNQVSGARLDVSLNFDFGGYPSYPAYEVEYVPVVVDQYDVIDRICDRYGCYDVVNTYTVYEDRPVYYYY